MIREKPSMPFSNGTEYECFMYEYCEQCKHGILRDDMFPEFPENGGCLTWDAMENARYGGEFPSQEIVELLEDNKPIKWHHCKRFEKNG